METYINRIFDYLAEILPADWGRLVIHMEATLSSYSMYFFVKGEGQQKYYSYNDLERAGFFTWEEFDRIHMAAGKETLSFLRSFRDPWTGYTLVIERSGKSEIDFEYEEQSLIPPQAWKEKYLV